MNDATGKRALALVAVLALACGPASGGNHHGPPLVTLRGQMVAGTLAATEDPVMLAIAWYPNWIGGGPSSPPRATVTQDATFHGSFPVSFSFDLYGPPPAEALVDLAPEGGSGHMSFGVLIAFEDRDGNGRLDIGTAGAPSPDRVLGVSTRDPSLASPPSWFYVTYLDGQMGPANELQGYHLPQGFGLRKAYRGAGGEMVPLETSISIPLTGTGAVGYYACADAFTNLDAPWEPACGIDPFEGGYHFEDIVVVRSPGSASWIGGAMNASGLITGAVVELNGTALSWVPEAGGYYGAPVVGANDLRLAVPGFAAEQLSFTVPGAINLHQPIPDTLPANSALSVSWDPVPGVGMYDLRVISLDDDHLIDYQLTTGTSITTAPLRFFGSGQVYVTLHAVGQTAVTARSSALTPLRSVAKAVTLTQ
ncbi:MAG TPA: hypothetical protein VND93_21325 [Myxococcales bacterium]|nr:hypothetical protein [Myxococcales bacterium]